LRIVVHGQQGSFRRAAEQAAHASVKAYYDATRNEVGLLLDMVAFRHYYANLDSLPDRYRETLSAFIAFAMDSFNEDSSHELAHVYQHQAQKAAYAIPAIREGEAEVQGMVRRRAGLIFNFLYNTPDAWVRGKFDSEVLNNRLRTLQASGRPMHPREVERLADLKRLRQAGRALRVGDLLAIDAQGFYAGTVTGSRASVCSGLGVVPSCDPRKGLRASSQQCHRGAPGTWPVGRTRRTTGSGAPAFH